MGDLIPISTARRQRTTGGGRRLERAAAAGDLVRIRHGAYIARVHSDTADPADLHRARVVATRLAARHEPVFSHESAAALHGIPLVGDWPLRARTTVADRARSTAAVQRTWRALADEDRAVLPDGSHATSLARTAVDLAATRSLLAGIVAMSHVRAHGVGLEELEAVLARAGRFPGVRRARIALTRSVAGSGSVLETLAVVRCQDYGFEPPEQQRPVVGVDGVEYRVDLAWRDGRILAEGDARDKDSAPEGLRGRSPSETLWAERRREDALRPMCERFTRFGWAEAWGGQGLARRLLALGVERRDRRLVALTF